jgi:hypothetical protein
MIAFALMLFFACVAAWIVSPNAYVRFAGALYAALAAACAVERQLAESVALIVCAVAPVSLGLALLRPSGVRFAPGFACIAGLAAAATGIAVLAFAPLLIASLAIAVARRRSMQAIAVSLALIATAASYLAGSLPALMAFASVGLLGAALQTSIEKQGRRNMDGVVISRAR